MRGASFQGFICLVLFCLAEPATHCWAKKQEEIDGIAAKVNNDVITHSQVRALSAQSEANARQTLHGQALTDQLKKLRSQALNTLIDRQLVLQEFQKLKAKGAEIPPHVLDDHINTIVRQQFGNDRNAFVRTLAAQGLTLERFRQQQEEEIIVQALRGQMIKPPTVVPEDRIRAAYERSIDRYTSDELMHLRMLVMRKSGTQPDPRRKLMEEIRTKIKDDVPFEELARIYSDDSSTQESGGDWGWINRRTFNEALSKVAFSLKPHQLSPIVDLAGNYYLLYCEDRKPQRVKPLAEVRDEIEKEVLQSDRQQLQQEWIARLRKKAFIQILP